ncbi:MAG: translocation/assembly module TamB domain-containing protein, partial [Geobacteraceae bacterium]|nr:translocation/assembly module TamB domain-containing protein [Geobacteraceae bacterium]
VSAGNAPFMQRPLDGEISTEIHNLDFIASLLPEVQSIAGRLTGTMTVTGSLETPVLFGHLSLSDGATEVERFGLDLKDIQIQLNAEGHDGIGLHAQATSAEGTLEIDGTSDLRGNADINVKGQKFRVINTLEAQVDASPDLAIALRKNRVDVDGEVLIPQAQITLKELPESAVGVSDDQVIVEAEDEGKEPTTRTREIHARVRTVLGDKVYFDGFGLKARIQGDILAIDKPGEPTTASGELRIVDGEYRAYGQGLVIETGRILFSGGPIGQPGIDVRAVRRPREGITVGVQARGDLRKPEFSLFSEPGMTQGNQLSYLVLGRPLSGTSSNEGSALSQAALVLGLKGGNAVAEKIGGSLGLDQFGLDTAEAGSNTNPQNATFVIGKYLSPRLYVSYGLGLFNEASTLRLQYTLGEHWKLISESSNEARGADVIYEIETGE